MYKKYCFDIGEKLIYNDYRNVKVIHITDDGFYILENPEGWRKRVYYKTLNRIADREIIGGC